MASWPLNLPDVSKVLAGKHSRRTAGYFAIGLFSIVWSCLTAAGKRCEP